MRAYFFVNSALSGIQKGMQVAHCVAEMGRQSEAAYFRDSAREATGFTDWAENHKTIIVLEGGFHAALDGIRYFLEAGKWCDVTEPPPPADHFHCPYPWASFTEDEETMNGMMTCVGIILPERIYEAARAVRSKEGEFFPVPIDQPTKYAFCRNDFPTEDFTPWEVELIKLLNSCPLAR